MPTIIRFRLRVPPGDCLRYYQGQAQTILVRADDGRCLQLPANCFRTFITHEGLAGRFEVELDACNKLLRLARIGD